MIRHTQRLSLRMPEGRDLDFVTALSGLCVPAVFAFLPDKRR